MTKMLKQMYYLRRFWLLSLWALLYLSSVGAQPLRPYVPMAIEGAHWAMDFYDRDNGRLWFIGRFHYLVKGDTIVNGRLYKKLYFCPNLSALIRDDSTARKVMILPIVVNRNICSDTTETVLYDFNLSASDSLKTCWKNVYGSSWNFAHQVVRNDTAMLFGKNRNILRFSNSSTYNLALVEGIGHYKSGIFPHDWIHDLYFPLAAYNVLNVTGCADPKVGAEEIPNPILEAVVFPNPAQHAIQITIPDAAMRQTHFSLHDLTGRVLKKGVFEGNQYSISVDEIANGIYMLRLKSQNQSITLKTIIFN